MTQEQQDLLDTYTKEQLWEAFTNEYNARKHTERNLNREIRNTARMRYDRDRYEEKYLQLHIEKHVSVDGSMDDALDYFFNHKKRYVEFTPSGGYYCYVDEGDHLFIVFAWHNPDKWRLEVRDMSQLIRAIALNAGKPIRYVGVDNVMKNHSRICETGDFELVL